ncbi:glycosyltransferase [bacterium CPR1]|nr:glycosyltransferase [bacterium CPR1]
MLAVDPTADYPVELPFGQVGMSDVMPYPSRTWSSLSQDELELYASIFKSRLTEAVDDFRPDVLHCHHLWLMTALARQLFPELRVVASCHGTDLRQLALAPQIAPRVLPWLKELDAAFALHAPQAEELIQRLSLSPQRVHVVGSGFAQERFQPPKERSPGPPRVLYVGKLSRAKGVPWLLEAVEGLSIDLTLVGGGEGPEADEIRDRAGSRAAGVLSVEKLVKAFQEADVFVLPSFSEGLPLVLLEALACGCRAVTSDLPGLPEFAPEWVRLIPLPRLIGPDTPVDIDLPEFVANLRAAIEAQCARPRSFDRAPGVAAWSWSAVFQSISRHYTRGAISPPRQLPRQSRR